MPRNELRRNGEPAEDSGPIVSDRDVDTLIPGVTKFRFVHVAGCVNTRTVSDRSFM